MLISYNTLLARDESGEIENNVVARRTTYIDYKNH